MKSRAEARRPAQSHIRIYEFGPIRRIGLIGFLGRHREAPDIALPRAIRIQIIDLVDSLVFVAQPAAGDLIQFMKAGILDWPDVFFVNKSDLDLTVYRSTYKGLIDGTYIGDEPDLWSTPMTQLVNKTNAEATGGELSLNVALGELADLFDRGGGRIAALTRDVGSTTPLAVLQRLQGVR